MRSIAEKPEGLSFLEAAAMPLTYVTAFKTSMETMEMRKGKDAALRIMGGLEVLHLIFIAF